MEAQKDGKENETPVIHGGKVQEPAIHLDTRKSTGPHSIHPRVLKQLVEELVEPFSINYQAS